EQLMENEKKEKPGNERAAADTLSTIHQRVDKVLAAEVLRFQRVQPQEEERKARVYARESGKPRAGEASDGLAVEQFFVLRKRPNGIGGDRCGGCVVTPIREKTKKKPRPRKP